MALFLAGCGTHPTAPTPPLPIPEPVVRTITSTLTMTDAETGAVLGTLETAQQLPALVTLSRPGYVTHEAWVRGTETVSLFPEARFDLAFYRQFSRGSLDRQPEALSVWAVAPRVYLQRAGLSDATVAALHAQAVAVVPALTGGRFPLAGWEMGEALPGDRLGVVTIELVTAADQPCGRASVGASAGHIWLNTRSACHSGGHVVHPPLLAHELGHALGFWHVDDPSALMTSTAMITLSGAVTPRERIHAAFAYQRPRGNMDIDRDAPVRLLRHPVILH